MGAKVERYFIPAVVGLAPVVFALISWHLNRVHPLGTFIMQTALPVLVAELFVIVVAFREGLVGFIRAHPLPRLAIVALLVWVALGIATSLFVAPRPDIATRWTLHWIIHLLFGFSVAYLCTRDLRTRDFVACYMGAFLIYACLFLIFVIAYWGQAIDWIHLFPGAIHIRHVGIYSAAMTGMSIGAMASVRNRSHLAVAIATATIGFALGLWTGSRGMVVSVMGATVVAAIFIPAMRSIRVIAGAAVSLAIAVAAMAWLPVPDAEMMGVARQVTATTERELTTGRLQIWSNVVDAIVRNPVFGYGPGQMPIVAPFFNMGQPHNLILQVLLDWGLVGFACVLIVSLYYLRRSIPVLKQKGELLAAPATAMLSLLLLSMIDAAMFHVLPLSIFAACAGLIAAEWRSPATNR